MGTRVPVSGPQWHLPGTYAAVTGLSPSLVVGSHPVSGASKLALPPSIQVRYGSSWSEKYGIPGGKAHELILHPGEHIISIYGRYRTFLQHVTLITNQGRSASFGLETGKGFFAAPNLTGQVLEGVYGQFWLYGITGIGFTWGFPREGLASVLPSDDPF